MVGTFQPTGIRPKFLERLRVSGIQLPSRAVRDVDGSVRERRRNINAARRNCISAAFSGCRALLISASGIGASERVKQTLARLDALLVTGQESTRMTSRSTSRSRSYSVRFRCSTGFFCGSRLHRSCGVLLYQANVKWTPGGLLLISLAAWAGVALT